MKFLKKVFSFIIDKIDKLFNSIFTLVCGLSLMQFPAYLTQYLQRLGGHIDEAKSFALKTKLPEAIARSKELIKGYHSIENSNTFLKLPNFIYNIDFDIAQKTYQKFTPGVAFNYLSIFYILIGIFLGIFLYSGIKGLLKKLFNLILNKIRKKKQNKNKQTNSSNQDPYPDLDNFDLNQFDKLD